MHSLYSNYNYYCISRSATITPYAAAGVYHAHECVSRASHLRVDPVTHVHVDHWKCSLTGPLLSMKLSYCNLRTNKHAHFNKIMFNLV